MNRLLENTNPNRIGAESRRRSSAFLLRLAETTANRRDYSLNSRPT